VKEQWVGVEYGDTFTATVDQDGTPAVRIDNRVWAGEEDRWITVSGIDRDSESNVRALAVALVAMADAMAVERAALSDA
jgi:hypothetical protein